MTVVIDHLFHTGDRVARDGRHINHTVGDETTPAGRPKTYCGWTIHEGWRWNHDAARDHCVACTRAVKRAQR